jgi:ABC-type transporter Mla subunit MlaD
MKSPDGAKVESKTRYDPESRRMLNPLSPKPSRPNLTAIAFLFLLVCQGCHRGVSVENGAPSPPPTEVVKKDPEADQYKKLRGADIQVDSAANEMNDGLQETKALAQKSQGDAQKALLSVIEQLSEAGESLGDYENVADTLDAFKKDFAAQDERRLDSIDIALDALNQVTDAVNTLNDLSANVPPAFKKDLDEIVSNVGQTQSDLQQAVVSMGGQVPDVGESVDPVQDDDQDSGTKEPGSKSNAHQSPQ